MRKTRIRKSALRNTQATLQEIRPLSHFLRIAEAGSLTKAAISLDISVSILSREMHELESSLGYAVFLRTGRGVRLTDLGARLYPRVKEFLIAASRLSEEAQALGGAPSGTVSIGLPGTVGEVLAGPLFRLVQRQYPKIFLQLSEGLSGAIDELLTAGRIDIGLFFTDSKNARPYANVLCAVELVLVGPPGDKLSEKSTVPLKRLDGIPLILPSRPHALRQRIEEAWAKHGLKLFVPFEADGLSTRKELVAAGGGYTVAPFDVFAGDIAADRIRVSRIVGPALTRYLVLSSARKGRMTMASQAVTALIPDIVRQLVAEGKLKALSS